jgi:Na+/H+-dicarboxylate symporter
MVTVVFTAALAAIGCAGVPAAGLVVLPMVLSAAGIPLEVIGMFAAVNRITDMISTTTNITGDTLTAIMVAKSEGELDLDTYYQDFKADPRGDKTETIAPLYLVRDHSS